MYMFFFFFSSRRRHTRSLCDWSSDVCSSDLQTPERQRFPCNRLKWLRARHNHRGPLGCEKSRPDSRGFFERQSVDIRANGHLYRTCRLCIAFPNWKCDILRRRHVARIGLAQRSQRSTEYIRPSCGGPHGEGSLRRRFELPERQRPVDTDRESGCTDGNSVIEPQSLDVWTERYI